MHYLVRQIGSIFIRRRRAVGRVSVLSLVYREGGRPGVGGGGGVKWDLKCEVV